MNVISTYAWCSICAMGMLWVSSGSPAYVVLYVCMECDVCVSTRSHACSACPACPALH